MADDDFREQIGDKRSGALRDLIGYLGHHRKWWLGPIVIAIVLLGVLVFLGSTGAAPFIYTLF
ncbi:MAG: hypothetical protein H6721_04540 [Sandaracinus sp.]|nr:hypothetical protein [Sandaracinus sp.]MCB9620557.1 hypothetical protein [Sandaracinus sp.]MCB9631394.1 hypothetical protein [Sandaracinus sp.]